MKIKLVVLLILIASLCVGGYPSAGAALEKTTTVTIDHGAQDPAVSPDGTQIAASILGKIWVLPLAGGDARQITTGIGWDTHPAWSPDGRFLAYAHQLPSGTDLIARTLATGGSNSLYHTESALGEIAYNPEGSELFFLLDRSQYDSHLY